MKQQKAEESCQQGSQHFKQTQFPNVYFADEFSKFKDNYIPTYVQVETIFKAVEGNMVKQKTPVCTTKPSFLRHMPV